MQQERQEALCLLFGKLSSNIHQTLAQSALLLRHRGWVGPVTWRSGQTWVTHASNINSTERVALLLVLFQRLALHLLIQNSLQQQRLHSFEHCSPHAWIPLKNLENISRVSLPLKAPPSLFLLLMHAHIFPGAEYPAAPPPAWHRGVQTLSDDSCGLASWARLLIGGWLAVTQGDGDEVSAH